MVLCAGSDLAACVISTNGNGNPNALVEWGGGTSNWAMSGFNVPSGSGTCATNGCRSFSVRVIDASCSVAQNEHHIAVINSITSNSMQGFGFNDCGAFGGVANAFVDYVATVGMIVQNSNRNGDFQGGICAEELISSALAIGIPSLAPTPSCSITTASIIRYRLASLSSTDRRFI